MSNAPECPECNAAPLRLHAPGCNSAAQAEAAYLRQGYEVALQTNFVDLESVHAHARHILDTCEGGRLMLERFRRQVERATEAEKVRDVALGLLSQMLYFYKSPMAFKRDKEYHPRFVEAMDAAAALVEGEGSGLERLQNFYLKRMDALQAYQHELPEPHRTIICNILANGKPKP